MQVQNNLNTGENSEVFLLTQIYELLPSKNPIVLVTGSLKLAYKKCRGYSFYIVCVDQGKMVVELIESKQQITPYNRKYTHAGSRFYGLIQQNYNNVFSSSLQSLCRVENYRYLFADVSSTTNTMWEGSSVSITSYALNEDSFYSRGGVKQKEIGHLDSLFAPTQKKKKKNDKKNYKKTKKKKKKKKKRRKGKD